MTKLRDLMRRGRAISGVLMAAVGLVIGLGAPVATEVAQAPSAGAVCSAYGPSGLYAYWGQQWADGGTCDWDNTYHGWLNDSITDGSCVWAEVIDAGSWGVQGWECNTGGWSDFWKWDYDGDFFSYLAMCRNQGCWANQWVGNWPY